MRTPSAAMPLPSGRGSIATGTIDGSRPVGTICQPLPSTPSRSNGEGLYRITPPFGTREASDVSARSTMSSAIIRASAKRASTSRATWSCEHPHAESCAPFHSRSVQARSSSSFGQATWGICAASGSA